MNLEGFKKLIDEIAAQGHSRETAAHYASLVAGLPTHDAAGNVLVMEGEKVIATLNPLKCYSHE